MSKFRIFTLWLVIAEILLILLANRLYFYQNNDSGGRLYLVEARRVIKEIEEQKLGASEIEAMSLNKYETIVGIKEFAPGEACDNDYLVEEIAGKLYRIEYVEERSGTVFQYWGKEPAEGNFRQSYGRLYPHGREQSFVETRTL